VDLFGPEIVGKMIIRIVSIKNGGDAQLPEVVGAKGGSRAVAGSRERRKEQSGQNRDNGYHHQQLDQGKSNPGP
jgi:hypothetical protein